MVKDINKENALRGAFDYFLYSRYEACYKELDELTGRWDSNFVKSVLDNYLSFVNRNLYGVSIEEMLTVIDDKIDEYEFFKDKFNEADDLEVMLLQCITIAMSGGRFSWSENYIDYYSISENYHKLVDHVDSLRNFPKGIFSHESLMAAMDRVSFIRDSWNVMIIELLKEEWDEKLYQKVLKRNCDRGDMYSHNHVTSFIDSMAQFIVGLHEIPEAMAPVLNRLKYNGFMDMAGISRKTAISNSITGYYGGRQRNARNKKAIECIIKSCNGSDSFKELGKTINRYYQNLVCDDLVK